VTLAEWSALIVGIAGVVAGLCAYVSSGSRKLLLSTCLFLIAVSLILAMLGTLTHSGATTAASQSQPTQPSDSPTSPSARPSSSSTGSPSPSPTSTPTPQPSGPPVGTPLTSDVEDGNPIISDGGDVFTDANGVSINGRTFVDSYEADCQLLCNKEETTWISLNLGRQYATLSARFGVSDDSLSSTKSATIEVIANGIIIYHRSFRVGQSSDVNLNISGVLRLIIQFSGPLGSVYPAVGDPTAYG
jgi:hypothetical protein